MGDSDRRRGGSGRSTPPSLTPRPPVEIIERCDEWIVEAYQGGHRDGETYATYDRRIDAMRGAKERMDERNHPCLLKWDADDIVGNIYWNPLFERLELRYDPLLEAWAVVPAESHYLFATDPSLDAACEAAMGVQRRFDFKRLDIYAADGTRREQIDHAFIRESIADSGVRFQKQPSKAVDDDVDDIVGEDAGADAGGADDSPASVPAGALFASVADLTEVTVESTAGSIHRYRATWTDGKPAAIAALSPEYSSHTAAVDAFVDIAEGWEEMSENEHVTTVFETGIGPSPWVAYRTNDREFATHGDSLSIRTRLRVCRELALALEVASERRVAGIGVAPENVRIVLDGEQKRATLSNWGLRWRVARALHADHVTPYTAPEQLDGSVTATTGVYQLGAFAYRLLAERAPFSEATDLKDAIRSGSPSPPSRHRRIPAAVDDVLSRAMAVDPNDRYDGADDLCAALVDAFR